MIDYSEDWLFTLLFRVKGSVGIRASTFAIPCAMFTLFLVQMEQWWPGIREDLGIVDMNQSTLWTATTSVLGLLLAFRTNRAMARFWEGTGLLHQMRGEWFDSISCLINFSVCAAPEKRLQVIAFRHTAVRLMSLCHGSALEEIAGEHGGQVRTIDPFGLDNDTLQHLNNCKMVHNFNRVEVLLHMTRQIITRAHEDGILKIPPPILSRVYQTLSRGFVNLLNAKKIADTRFPFPYAQLITMLLFLHCLLTPLFISCLIPSRVWAPLIAFVPIYSFFSLNFIGVELENPFGSDDNDLPLDHFQGEMNKCLMMLLQEGADLVPGISPSRCIMKYSNLSKSLKQADDLAGYTGEHGNEKEMQQRLSNFLIMDLNSEGVRSSGGGETFASCRTRNSIWGSSFSIEQEPEEFQNLAGFPMIASSSVLIQAESDDLLLRQARLGKDVLLNRSSSALSGISSLESSPTISSLASANVAAVGAITLRYPPVVPEEKKLEPKATEWLDPRLCDYPTSVPKMQELVESQVRELVRNTRALSDFSSNIDSMLSARGLIEGQVRWGVRDQVAASQWRSNMPAMDPETIVGKGLSTTQFPIALHAKLAPKVPDREVTSPTTSPRPPEPSPRALGGHLGNDCLHPAGTTLGKGSPIPPRTGIGPMLGSRV